MNVTHVVFDINSFGITQRSLKILRDALTENINHRIAVVEIPTNDLCCGFFIFDWEWQRATWTGDGFRMDRCGEGGAGYRSAEVLFNLFGIKPLVWDEIRMDKFYMLPEKKIEAKLLELARKIAQELRDDEFQTLVDKEPEYIR
jgi:hypothetical protein